MRHITWLLSKLSEDEFGPSDKKGQFFLLISGHGFQIKENVLFNSQFKMKQMQTEDLKL